MASTHNTGRQGNGTIRIRLQKIVRRVRPGCLVSDASDARLQGYSAGNGRLRRVEAVAGLPPAGLQVGA